MNNFTDKNPDASTVRSNTGRVIRNRDYYVENTNQGAQNESDCPFRQSDEPVCAGGTKACGIGHGTLANRPATCTTGVAYWATDQGTWNNAPGGQQGQIYVSRPRTRGKPARAVLLPHPLVSGVQCSGEALDGGSTRPDAGEFGDGGPGIDSSVGVDASLRADASLTDDGAAPDEDAASSSCGCKLVSHGPPRLDARAVPPRWSRACPSPS